MREARTAKTPRFEPARALRWPIKEAQTCRVVAGFSLAWRSPSRAAPMSSIALSQARCATRTGRRG
ncbi:hypothetical protein RALTA_B2230 [Cupriavidus taiwanensis LMG 19424]|uniref:Uncharacterized protein n=1 Tax=Cupriavidus taiwanensis (strain DSM 17343 / BCRC 17206 / CCUG 44338 / CIP 107171 / LMG 19424 / R1) TaxID=977880 RepID=B3RD32_CUPTR|nr:hypothetical protein RALTA_B2230 [Cupriavidus taiwanensis LMG 19424]